MGQEILYCFKCQSRIVSSEFEKGDAYRIDDRAACARCTRELLPTFPLPKQREILNQAKKREPTPSPEGSSKTPRRAMVAAPAPPPRAGVPVAAAMAGVTVVALILILVASSGGTPTAPVAAPAPPVSPPPPVPAAFVRERAAQGALDLARGFARDNPADLDGQIRLVEKVASEYAGTDTGKEARREADRLAEKRKKALADELSALLEEARPILAAEEFQKANEFLGSAKKRHAQAEWTAPLEAKENEIVETMTRVFPGLKERAVEAKKKGRVADVQATRAQVARWGFDMYLADLDKALVEALPPVAAKEKGILHLRVAEGAVFGKKVKKTGEGDWCLTQNWGGTDSGVEWTAVPRSAGTYTVQMNYACPKEWAGEISLTVGEVTQVFKIEPTANWGEYKLITLGTIAVPGTSCRVAVQPAKLASTGSMSLRFVNLVPK